MLKNISKLDNDAAKQMQPLALAMIGDAVQTLFVRKFVALEFGVKVNKINKLVSSVVSAGAQFKTFKKLEDSLTKEEQDIARRARNTHKTAKQKILVLVNIFTQQRLKQ